MEKKEHYKTLFPNLLKDKKLIMEDALSTKYQKRKINYFIHFYTQI